MELAIIKELGFPIGIVVVLLVGFSWMMKTVMKHFINTIDDMSRERKETNASFVSCMNKMSESLNDNSAAIKGIDDLVRELILHEDRGNGVSKHF